jgi:microcystin-dependent protein
MPSAINTHTPIGQVIQAQVSVSPSGYLYCDGTAVSRTTYSALFAAIGTAHGIGDGSTTFNLPDLRGKFLRGVSDSTSNDPDKASRTAVNGGNSGNTVGSVQSHAMTDHAHQSNGNHNVVGTGGGLIGSANFASVGSGNSLVGPASTVTSNTSSETRPINVYTNFYIKY